MVDPEHDSDTNRPHCIMNHIRPSSKAEEEDHGHGSLIPRRLYPAEVVIDIH